MSINPNLKTLMEADFSKVYVYKKDENGNLGTFSKSSFLGRIWILFNSDKVKSDNVATAIKGYFQSHKTDLQSLNATQVKNLGTNLDTLREKFTKDSPKKTILDCSAIFAGCLGGPSEAPPGQNQLQQAKRLSQTAIDAPIHRHRYGAPTFNDHSPLNPQPKAPDTAPKRLEVPPVAPSRGRNGAAQNPQAGVVAAISTVTRIPGAPGTAARIEADKLRKPERNKYPSQAAYLDALEIYEKNCLETPHYRLHQGTTGTAAAEAMNTGARLGAAITGLRHVGNRK